MTVAGMLLKMPGSVSKGTACCIGGEVKHLLPPKSLKMIDRI